MVQSRYSIVIATAKRARQIITGEEPMVSDNGKKPLPMVVEGLYESGMKIVSGEDPSEEEDN